MRHFEVNGVGDHEKACVAVERDGPQLDGVAALKIHQSDWGVTDWP